MVCLFINCFKKFITFKPFS